MTIPKSVAVAVRDITYAAAFVLVLFLLVTWPIMVFAQPASTVDAAALQSIARANQGASDAVVATARSGMCSALADSKDCKTGECVIATKAIAALSAACGQTLAQLAQATQPQPAPQIIQTQRDVSVGERIVGLFAGGVGKVFDTAIALGPSWLNYKLGTVQSNNQTALGIVASNNALGATQSTNGTFAAFGNNITSTAISGFTASQGIAANGFSAASNIAANGFSTASVLGSRPTNVTTITGNGNATNGSTINNTTNTADCPNESGPATGAPTGNTGTGPTSGQSGAAAAQQSGPATVNCNAGK